MPNHLEEHSFILSQPELRRQTKTTLGAFVRSKSEEPLRFRLEHAISVLDGHLIACFPAYIVHLEIC